MTEIKLHTIDWCGRDIEESFWKPQYKIPKYNYQIDVFGVTDENESVTVRISGFKPYFFIQIPEKLETKKQEEQILKYLKSLLPTFIKNDLCTVYEGSNYVQKFNFNGYQFNIKKHFLKLTFFSERGKKSMVKALLMNSIDYENIYDEDEMKEFQKLGYSEEFFSQAPLFENDIDPLLRFYHEFEINPSGACQLTDFFNTNQVYSNATYDLQVNYDNVKPVNTNKNGGFIIASFDIEADSSHGDFPEAIKDYTKFCKELIAKSVRVKKENTNRVLLPIGLWTKYVFKLIPYSKQYDVEELSCVNTKKGIKPSMIEIENFSENAEKIIAEALRVYMKCNSTEWKKKRKYYVNKLLLLTSRYNFPAIEGDRCIQIGTAFIRYGEKEPFLKHIVTLKGCSPLEEITVESFESEKEVILCWVNLLKKINPHVITGYNIFGFDWKFLWERACELEITNNFKMLSIVKNEKCEFTKKELNSAGLGENFLYYMTIPGIVQVDLMKVIMRDHKLDSYKLDNVASTFINGKVLKYEIVDDLKTRIYTDNIYALRKSDFVIFQDINSLIGDSLNDGQKFKIIEISDEKWFDVNCVIDFSTKKSKYKWGLAKDDVSVNDIFRMQNEGDNERSIIAKYCIQDCVLVINLLLKLELMANNMGMSTVCRVPLQWIFTRGQGIKTYSLVSYECRNSDCLIPYKKKEYSTDNVNSLEVELSDDDDENDGGDNDDLKHFKKMTAGLEEKEVITDGYEGAVVLKPNPGIYLKHPVSVLDYASLYPSSMISENLSHCSIILDPEYLGNEGLIRLKELGLVVKDITYDNYIYRKKGKTVKKERNKDIPSVTCRFVQPPLDENGVIIEEKRGIIPRTLIKLLKSRKNTRNIMKTEKDTFRLAVLEGLQLAYKVTANSLYGSVGAPVNPIYMKDIAACTTATGRKHLFLARDYILKNYKDAEIVYGDTDSIFINFNAKDKNGRIYEGTEALQKSIELGEEASEGIQPSLEKPQCLEYEKTFYPFILFSKKKYVGMKYETDTVKCKMSSMGIVLKRRDNPPILKYIYGEIIDEIMLHKNLEGAIASLHKNIEGMLKGEFPLEYFILSKCLKTKYENPEAIVHKVLADRIADRGGTKALPNDRIPYVYFDIGDTKVNLQGDRVEDPQYIRDNNLKVDYGHYIDKQLCNPIGQIFSLTIESLPQYKKPKDYFTKKESVLLKSDTYRDDEAKLRKKMTDLRVSEVKALFFQKYLNSIQNKVKKQPEITSFFLSKYINK
jgi:DNA polymerase elongation subunit (family B)